MSSGVDSRREAESSHHAADQSANNISDPWLRLHRHRHLHLHRLANLCPRSARSDEIAFGCGAVALSDLAYRANRVNDRSAGRIAHEPGKSFEVAGAFWVVRERQHKRLLWRQSGNGGLQDLHNALVE